ncbi:MAG TPA: HAD family phosphatase [Bauldia sp.]|nr:HAD family phosphatase [Bauldia sp.]
MTDIRHVVFDLGQVLIAYDPEAPYRRLLPDERERRRFLTEVTSHQWNVEQDRGRAWREAEDLLIAEHPHHADLIRAFRANWWEMIPGQIDANIAIVAELIDRGVDVTALTNWAPDTFAEAEARFPILRRFRGVTVSGRVRLVKPDPAIYRLHAATFGLEPDATLFFDDNSANVAAARSVGWHAERYVSTETLAADLRRYGLVP